MGLDNTKQVGALWKRPNRGYNVFLNNRKYLALPPENEGTDLIYGEEKVMQILLQVS